MTLFLTLPPAASPLPRLHKEGAVTMPGVRVVEKGRARLAPRLQVGEIIRLAPGALYTVVRTTESSATVARRGSLEVEDKMVRSLLSCQVSPASRMEISLHSHVERISADGYEEMTREKETGGWVIELDDAV